MLYTNILYLLWTKMPRSQDSKRTFQDSKRTSKRTHHRKERKSDPPVVPVDDSISLLPFFIDTVFIKKTVLLSWLFFVDPSCDASKVVGNFFKEVILWFANNTGSPSVEQLDIFRDTLTRTLTRHIGIVESHKSETNDWLSASLLAIAGLIGAKSLDDSMPTPLARHGITPHNVVQFLDNVSNIGASDLPEAQKITIDKTDLSTQSFVPFNAFIVWMRSPSKTGDEQKRPRYQKEQCKILCRNGMCTRAYEIWKGIHFAKLEAQYMAFLGVVNAKNAHIHTPFADCASLPQFLEQFRPHTDHKLFETVSKMHPDVLKNFAFSARDNFCRPLPSDFTLVGLRCPLVRRIPPKRGNRVIFDVRKACFRSLAIAMHLSGLHLQGISDWLEPDISTLWEKFCVEILQEHPEFAFSKEWRQKVVNLIATQLRFVGMITAFNQFVLEMCAQALGTCCEYFTTCDSASALLPCHLTIEEALDTQIQWFGRTARIADFIKIDPAPTETSLETKNSFTRKAEVRNTLKHPTHKRDDRRWFGILPKNVQQTWKTHEQRQQQVWKDAAATLADNPNMLNKEQMRVWKNAQFANIDDPSKFLQELSLG
jgi:hypothetical protein